MKRKCKIILFLCLICSTTNNLFAQSQKSEPKISFTKQYSYKHFTPALFTASFLFSDPKRPVLRGPYVPKAYNYEHLAFFCKLEVNMEKSARLPIKVRLGDVDYVDWLEGKRRNFD